MAKLDSIRKAKRTGKADRPFGEPSASDNGRFEILIPEGAETGVIPDSDQYIGQCSNVIRNISQKGKGNPQLVFTFKLVSPKKYRGMSFDLHCPLIPNSMWKLTDTLTALGQKVVPGKKVTYERDEMQGVLVRLNIKKDPGKDGFRDQSKIMNVLPHPDGAGKKAALKKDFPLAEEEPEEQEEQDLEEQDEEEDEVEVEVDDDEEDEDAEEDEDEGDEDIEGEEEEDEDEEEGDEEEEDEGGKGWNTAKEAEQFSRKAGRPRIAKDADYGDVTPKRRSGPKMEEKPVKRGPGRPPKKKPRR